MPAAAVIPAPVAYTKVVAVKTLVVGLLAWTTGPSLGRVSGSAWPSWLRCCPSLGSPLPDYFEEMRVFQAGVSLVYFSIE